MPHFETLLLEEQAEAVKILSQPVDHLLAYGTGLGKTYAALASYEAVKRKNPAGKFHLLVVCTKSATVTWRKEIETKTNYKYFLCRPEWTLQEYAPLFPGDEDITIVTYHQLEEARFYLEKLFLTNKVILVLDEMHKIKNRKFYRDNDKNKGMTWYGLCKVLRQHSLVTWGLTACPTGRVRIPTRRGLLLASEVKQGDFVFYEGKEYLVRGNKRNDKESIIRIETKSGYWFEGNEEHPLRTRDGWKFLRDISCGDKVELTFNYRCGGSIKEYKVPRFTVINGKGGVCVTQNEANTEKIKMSFDLAKILAWLVGDGWLDGWEDGKQKRVGFVFSSKDYFIREELKGILNGWGYSTYERNRGNWGELTVNSKQLFEFMRFVGGIKRGAKNKTIPDIMWNTQTNFQKVFLKYLWRTDGNVTIDKNKRVWNVRYSSDSILLADDIQIMLGLIGIKTLKRVGSVRRDTECVVSIDPAHRQKFLDEIGTFDNITLFSVCQKGREGIEFFFSEVRSIDRFEDFTYAIEVEGGVYNSNCLVSHNTPLLNHIEDLFVLVDFLFPKVLGTKTSYMRQFTIQKMRKMGLITFFEVVGYRNLNILHEIIKPYVLVRFREYDVRFISEVVELTPEENTLYLRAAMGILGGTYKDFAARLPDLQRAADTGGAIGSDTEVLSKVSSKERRCVELVAKKLAEDKAVIVYSSLKEPVDRLKRLFKKEFPDVDIYVITGATSLEKREAVVENFKKKSIIVMTGAGGESLNLQVSNTVIFFNLTFSIGEFVQVVGRVVRVNTEHNFMEVFIIEAKDTIDTYKRLMLEHNADKIKKVISQNPNLPEIDSEPTKDYIIKMRKDLLWKKKELRSLAKGKVYA